MAKFTARQLDQIPGLIRTPAKDFKDDGARFTLYDYRGLEVSYSTDRERVYIAIHRPCEITYAFWTKYLDSHPQYRDVAALADRWNGVPKTAVDVDALSAALFAYHDFIEHTVRPAFKVWRAEMTDRFSVYSDCIRAQAAALDNELKQLTADFDFFNSKLSDYELKTLRGYYNTVKQNIARMLGALEAGPGDSFWLENVETVIHGATHYNLATDSFYMREIAKLVSRSRAARKN